jgi:hypothetical protein
MILKLNEEVRIRVGGTPLVAVTGMLLFPGKKRDKIIVVSGKHHYRPS